MKETGKSREDISKISCQVEKGIIMLGIIAWGKNKRPRLYVLKMLEQKDRKRIQTNTFDS